MKKHVLTFLILTMVAKGYAQYVRYPFTNEKINGNVISLITFDCIIRPPGAVDTSFNVIKFNEKGEAIEMHNYKVYDALFQHPRWRDTDQMKRYEQTWDSYLTHYRDSEGHKLKSVFTRGTNKYVLIYDKNEQVKKQLTYNAKDDLINDMSNKYDKNGNLLKLIIYVPYENSLRSQEYKYDENNLMTVETYYHLSTSRKFFFKFSDFDAMNNWTKCTRTDEKGSEFIMYRKITYAQTPSK